MLQKHIKQGRECRGRGVSAVSTGDREPLTETVIFQQSPEGEKGSGREDMEGRAFWSEGTRLWRLNHPSCVKQQQPGRRLVCTGQGREWVWLVR